MSDQQRRPDIHQHQGVGDALPRKRQGRGAPPVNHHIGPHDEAHHDVLARKGPQRERAVHLHAKLDAHGQRGEEDERAGARESPRHHVGEEHDGVPAALHLNGRLADGAFQRAVGALAVGDPAQHAVLVRLEGAGARVDPGARGVGGVLVGQADEAAARGVGGAGGDGDGVDGGLGEAWGVGRGHVVGRSCVACV